MFGGNEVPKFALAWYMHQCSSYVVTIYNVHVAITYTFGAHCSNCYSTYAMGGIEGLKIAQNITFQRTNLNVSGIKAPHPGLYIQWPSKRAGVSLGPTGNIARGTIMW